MSNVELRRFYYSAEFKDTAEFKKQVLFRFSTFLKKDEHLVFTLQIFHSEHSSTCFGNLCFELRRAELNSGVLSSSQVAETIMNSAVLS